MRSVSGGAGTMTRTRWLPAAFGGGLLVAAFAVGVVLLAHPLAVRAATCDTSWVNTAVSGNWTDATKWDNGVPDSTKNTCLPNGSYTVTVFGTSSQAKS